MSTTDQPIPHGEFVGIEYRDDEGNPCLEIANYVGPALGSMEMVRDRIAFREECGE